MSFSGDTLPATESDEPEAKPARRAPPRPSTPRRPTSASTGTTARRESARRASSATRRSGSKASKASKASKVAAKAASKSSKAPKARGSAAKKSRRAASEAETESGNAQASTSSGGARAAPEERSPPPPAAKKKWWQFGGKKDGQADTPGKAKKSAARGPFLFRSQDHSDLDYQSVKFNKFTSADALRKAVEDAFPEYAGYVSGLANSSGKKYSLDKFVDSSADKSVNYHIVCGKRARVELCRHCHCFFKRAARDSKKRVGPPKCAMHSNGKHETADEYKEREDAEELEQKKRASKIRKKYKGCATCRAATLEKTRGLELMTEFGPQKNYKCKKCGCYWTDNSGMPMATRGERRKLTGPLPPDEIDVDDVSTGELDPESDEPEESTEKVESAEYEYDD